MSEKKRTVSNLEYLQSLDSMKALRGLSLNDATLLLTDPMNCVECIAEKQCADRYGQKTGENTGSDCLTVVAAYLKQDHKEVKKENGYGEH